MPDNSPAACPLPPQLRARYAAFWERTELDRPILFFTAPAQERPPPHPDDQRPAAVQRAMRRIDAAWLVCWSGINAITGAYQPGHAD